MYVRLFESTGGHNRMKFFFFKTFSIMTKEKKFHIFE